MITYLEMRDASQLCPKECMDSSFRISALEEGGWEFNRSMYKRVGSPWKWTDKQDWSDEQWVEYSSNPGLHTFIAYHDRAVAGYFELLEQNGEVELIYFGLVSEFIGRGFGGSLLTRAIIEAWRLKPKRVWVHTCDQDHPAAVANYEARGMLSYKTEPS